MKITGRLTDKDGVNEIRRGTSPKGKDWVLYGGSIKVDGKKYNLKAEFEDHKDTIEDMLNGLMVNDNVEVSVVKNSKGFDEVTSISCIGHEPATSDGPEDIDYETVSMSDEAPAPESNTNSLPVVALETKDPKELGVEITKFGTNHNVRFTQTHFDGKNDRWVAFCFYDKQ